MVFINRDISGGFMDVKVGSLGASVYGTVEYQNEIGFFFSTFSGCFQTSIGPYCV